MNYGNNKGSDYLIYETLLDEADSLGLTVKEFDLKGNKGRIKGNCIAIKKDMPTLKEKACVLAEELGHYHTTTGNIIDLRDVRNRKQELKGRIWAYDKQVGLMEIIRCFEHRCSSKSDMAEYLDVTEEFLLEALTYYKSKHGLFVKLDNYIIYFDPLGVVKMI